MHNSQRVGMTQMSTDRWEDNVVHLQNGILLKTDGKLAHASTTCVNLKDTPHEISESQKTHTIWFYLYEGLRLAKFRETENEQTFPGVGGRGGELWFCRFRASVWDDEKFLEMNAQSCMTLCDPMDCSPPGSSVHGILQARILEWVAISFSRGSSLTRDRTQVSRVAGRLFTVWATIYSMNVLNVKYGVSLVAQQ